MKQRETFKLKEQINEAWYYVVIQSPGTSDEKLLGYSDEETQSTFIPCFKTKETAQQCFLLMPKDIMKEKYEVQAVIGEDLIRHAEENRFNIFLLDDKGKILEQIL